MGSDGASQIVYIGIGSNLGDRVEHLWDAVKAVEQFGGLISVSSVYETEPFGVRDEDQPMYLNMVVGVRTSLEPKRLLVELLRIETENGRVRHRRGESRTLDLDILMYGKGVVESSELHIPHPRMHRRAFVMMPLAEIAPELVVPTLGKTVSEIAAALPDQGVRRVGEIEDLAAGSAVTSLAAGPE